MSRFVADVGLRKLCAAIAVEECPHKKHILQVKITQLSLYREPITAGELDLDLPVASEPALTGRDIAVEQGEAVSLRIVTHDGLLEL